MRDALIRKNTTMLNSFTTCILTLAVAVFIGCNTTEKKEEATKSSSQPDSVTIQTTQGEKQYRAVCVEKDEHGGTEYVLSRWLDSRDKANELGQYHGDFKYKGHQWRIDERIKPAKQ